MTGAVGSWEDRRWRALAWIVVAVLGVLVAGVVYLRPSISPPAAASTAKTRSSPSLAWRLSWAFFTDADHGTAQLAGFGPSPTRTYLTADGGRTWRLVARGSGGGFAYAYYFDSHTVFEQTTRGALPPFTSVSTRISIDGGRTWRSLVDPRLNKTSGLPSFVDARHAWWLDRQPSSDPHAPIAIWRTSDGGQSWSRLTGAGITDSGFVMSLAFADELRGVILFGDMNGGSASILTTTDGGESWRMGETPVVPRPDLKARSPILLRHGTRLLALTVASADSSTGPLISAGALGSPAERPVYSGIFVSVSEDNGQTWSPPRPGPSTVQPVYVFVLPQMDDRGRLLLLDDRQLWISVDEGATWTARMIQAPAGLRPTMLAGARQGVLYALAL